MKLIVIWLNILDVNGAKVVRYSMQQFKLGQHHIISAGNDSQRSKSLCMAETRLILTLIQQLQVLKSNSQRDQITTLLDLCDMYRVF